MMFKFLIAAVVILVCPVMLGCAGGHQAPPQGLTVAAPDYLKGILDRAATQFKEENGIPVEIMYLPPDSIKIYGEHSIRVDVFIGADPKQFAAFKKDTSLVYGRYSCPFALSVVLAGRIGGPRTDQLDGLKDAEFHRIVIVDPSAGYEGKLAETALRKKHVWNKIQNRLILARSTDQLLSYLTSGEADAAVMLESSLYGSTGLTVMSRLDDLFGERLIHCGAVTADSRNKASAKAFLDLLDLRLCPMYDIPGIKCISN
jgi:molybdate transport system substrate-binding protein